jgi:hypothetical protein
LTLVVGIFPLKCCRLDGAYMLHTWIEIIHNGMLLLPTILLVCCLDGASRRRARLRHAMV